MQDLAGRTAVVTGGGSGIGRGIAHACADADMHVVLADIDVEAVRTVAGEIEAKGVRGLAIPTDVTDPASLEALAYAAYHAFGAVHLLCNNAGVLTVGPLAETTDAQWRWVLAVNLFGVIDGVRAFLPRLRAQHEEAHIVNTASIAGLITTESLPIGAYTVSKFGVVAYSDTLRAELAPEGIGVSVLCPGGVRTRIAEAERNRPAHYGGPNPEPLFGGPAAMQEGMDPLDVGRAVLRGVRGNRARIFTHAETRAAVEARCAALAADYAFYAADG